MENLGSAAATEIDSKISEFRTLQEELSQHNVDLGTLMAQRNENEMVLKELEVCEMESGDGGDCVIYKQVRV
jgi:chaperonin cofactor prefoldin